MKLLKRNVDPGIYFSQDSFSIRIEICKSVMESNKYLSRNNFIVLKIIHLHSLTIKQAKAADQPINDGTFASFLEVAKGS
jgi:hypothetical protein